MYVTLHTMLHEHWVILIIVPSFSCPFYTRLLYIIGSNSSGLWRSSEIEIQNQIDEELSEFTWFNEETCTNGKRLTAPCSKSEIESSVSILSIAWWLYFHVKWNMAWTIFFCNVTYSCDQMKTNKMHIWQHVFFTWTYFMNLVILIH